MDPIDSIARAMQLLRRRLPAGGSRPARSEGSAAPATTVQAQLAARLATLDPAAAGYAEHATELFVEQVLLAEFGGALTNDPQFRQVILGVAREMRTQPDVARDLDSLIQSLVRP